MKLVIIGGGTMGSAIAKALVDTKTLSHSELLIIEPALNKHKQLKADLGCYILEKAGSETSSYNAILLAVKPQVSSTVLKELSAYIKSDQVVISIMAGVSISQMMKDLQHSSIVRAMPNTPSQIGEGMSVYYPTEQVTTEQLKFIQTIFQMSGTVLAVSNEDAIDAATAISGSGPAYIFYVAEQMIAQAQELGFSQNEATRLVQQTIKGAVSLWQSQSLPADELRRQVTSPGGTTEAAIKTFEEKGVGQGLQEGIQAAYQRAKELA